MKRCPQSSHFRFANPKSRAPSRCSDLLKSPSVMIPAKRPSRSMTFTAPRPNCVIVETTSIHEALSAIVAFQIRESEIASAQPLQRSSQVAIGDDSCQTPFTVDDVYGAETELRNRRDD